MVKIIATVDARIAPIDTGLVFVMARAVFCQYAFSIGSLNWVQVRPKISLGILG